MNRQNPQNRGMNRPAARPPMPVRTAINMPDEHDVRIISASDDSALPLAMAYVPWQRWGETYSAGDALTYGTVFTQLYLPFMRGAKP